MEEKRIPCMLCPTELGFNKKCGKLWTQRLSSGEYVSAHQKCMQYASGLTQNLFDHFGGFEIDDVRKKITAGKRLKCFVCKTKKQPNRPKTSKGATVGCELKQCPKIFHFYCAHSEGLTYRGKRKDGGRKLDLYFAFCCKDHKNKYQKNAVAAEDSSCDETADEEVSSSSQSDTEDADAKIRGSSSRNAERKKEDGNTSETSRRSHSGARPNGRKAPVVKIIGDCLVLSHGDDEEEEEICEDGNDGNDETKAYSERTGKDNEPEEKDEEAEEADEKEDANAEIRGSSSGTHLSNERKEKEGGNTSKTSTTRQSRSKAGRKEKDGNMPSTSTRKSHTAARLNPSAGSKAPTVRKNDEYLVLSCSEDEEEEEDGNDDDDSEVCYELTGKDFETEEEDEMEESNKETEEDSETDDKTYNNVKTEESEAETEEYDESDENYDENNNDDETKDSEEEEKVSKKKDEVEEKNKGTDDEAEALNSEEEPLSRLKAALQFRASSTEQRLSNGIPSSKGTKRMEADSNSCNNNEEVKSPSKRNGDHLTAMNSLKAESKKQRLLRRTREEAEREKNHSARETVPTSSGVASKEPAVNHSEYVMVILGEPSMSAEESRCLVTQMANTFDVDLKSVHAWQPVTTLPADCVLFWFTAIINAIKNDNFRDLVDLVSDDEEFWKQLKASYVSRAGKMKEALKDDWQMEVLWRDLKTTTNDLLVGKAQVLYPPGSALPVLALNMRLALQGCQDMLIRLNEPSGTKTGQGDRPATSNPQKEALILQLWTHLVYKPTQLLVCPSEKFMLAETKNEELARLAQILQESGCLEKEVSGSNCLVIFQPADLDILQFEKYMWKVCCSLMGTEGVKRVVALVPCCNLPDRDPTSLAELNKKRAVKEPWAVNVYCALPPDTFCATVLVVDIQQ